MEFNECIEGDYIETKENNLFFDVKGIFDKKNVEDIGYKYWRL